MDATILSQLDTLFKEMEGLHRLVNKGSASLIERDLLADKVRLYYSLLNQYAPSYQPTLSTSNNPETAQIKPTEETINIAEKEVEEHPANKIQPPAETIETPIQYNFNTTYSKRKELKNLIDINTRIGLIKYFFHGNIDDYNAALSQLDQASNLQEAEKTLNEWCQKQGFDKDHDLFQALQNIIRRSF